MARRTGSTLRSGKRGVVRPGASTMCPVKAAIRPSPRFFVAFSISVAPLLQTLRAVGGPKLDRPGGCASNEGVCRTQRRALNLLRDAFQDLILFRSRQRCEGIPCVMRCLEMTQFRLFPPGRREVDPEQSQLPFPCGVEDLRHLVLPHELRGEEVGADECHDHASLMEGQGDLATPTVAGLELRIHP